MKDECKHQFDDRHPYYLQCTLCEKTIPVIFKKRMSQESFKELFPSLTREVGDIIINEWKS